LRDPALRQTRWLKVDAMPLFHPGAPQPALVITALTGSTALQSAAAALRASEERFAQAFQAAPAAVARDLAAMRRTARQLERMNQLYAALSQVNQAIVQAPTQQALLDRICEVMVRFGTFQLAWIGWNDPATGEVAVLSQYGDAGGYLRDLKVRSDDSPLGRGGTGTAIREGRTIVLNDFHATQAAAPWHEAARCCGLAGSASIPIRQEGRVWGALMVYAHDKDFFGPQELGLLEQAAGDVTSALDHRVLVERRREAEAEAAALQAQLQQTQKMESLGNLAGGVAHDMNNVLGAILAMASIHLERQPPDSAAYHAFDTIAQAATRGGKMVRSLLNFARRRPAELEELDLNAIIREQVELLAHTTLAKVQLDMVLADRPVRILGDGNALAHAIMNLCVNAVDAMPAFGTLTLGTRKVGRTQVEVTVEDTGTGMSKEVMARALDPFFTTKEVGKGTGLGLSMVYSTVKAHHGTLGLDSAPGRGTRVSLRFPASTMATPNPDARREAEDPYRPGLKVLLVDDDALVRTSTQSLLELLGHLATVAATGEEALAKVEAGYQPDLVLLDLDMPGLGGAGTLPRLRALCPDLPILITTGTSGQDAQDLATAHPRVALLPKPYDAAALKEQFKRFGK
jgi:signal transduction histidine kinase